MDKVIRILTWTVFGLGFVLVVLVSLLASLTGRQAFAQQPPPGGTRSMVKVTVPAADAELLIDGQTTRTTGKSREYVTPELEAGKKYAYELRVVWKPDPFTTLSRTRTIKFVAGEDVPVDMTAPQPTDTADVQLKAAPADAVTDVVKAAAITKNDVVFEPKTTDARFVIEAVKAGAKRGVGVQPDADKLKAAKAAVTKAELEGKIDLHQTDATEEKDYAEATVVILYTGEEANLILRPVLLAAVKPGTRIVSYRFSMDDWKHSVAYKGTNADGDAYEVFVWTVTEADKKKYGKK